MDKQLTPFHLTVLWATFTSRDVEYNFVQLYFFIPTSIYFSQCVHDNYGLLLHLRKRISLLLSLCSEIPHVDVASIYDMFFGWNFNLFFYRWLFFPLSFFGCLMRWSDWDGLDEEKRLAYIFWLVDAVTVVMQKYFWWDLQEDKLFKNHMHDDGAAEWQFGHNSGAGRRQREAWKWDWRQLSSSRLTMCLAHFVFDLVSWPHWTGNAREDWQEVLNAGPAKIKRLDKKCWIKKKVLEKKKNQFAVWPVSLSADDQKLSDIWHHYLLSLWKCKIYCTQVTNKNHQSTKHGLFLSWGGRSSMQTRRRILGPKTSEWSQPIRRRRRDQNKPKTHFNLFKIASFQEKYYNFLSPAYARQTFNEQTNMKTAYK